MSRQWPGRSGRALPLPAAPRAGHRPAERWPSSSGDDATQVTAASCTGPSPGRRRCRSPERRHHLVSYEAPPSARRQHPGPQPSVLVHAVTPRRLGRRRTDRSRADRAPANAAPYGLGATCATKRSRRPMAAEAHARVATTNSTELIQPFDVLGDVQRPGLSADQHGVAPEGPADLGDRTDRDAPAISPGSTMWSASPSSVSLDGVDRLQDRKTQTRITAQRATKAVSPRPVRTAATTKNGAASTDKTNGTVMNACQTRPTLYVRGSSASDGARPNQRAAGIPSRCPDH